MPLKKTLSAVAFISALSLAGSSFAADLCAGKTAGTVSFYNQEVSRGEPLPQPVTEFDFDSNEPMFALLCLTDKASAQEAGGKKFRVVLYVKQTKSFDGKYSSYQHPKLEGVFRPQISSPKKDIIIVINEDFDLSSLVHKLDPGEYEFRVQAASEKGTGTFDLTIDWSNDVAYIQELRKAGYLADGKVKVVKK